MNTHRDARVSRVMHTEYHVVTATRSLRVIAAVITGALLCHWDGRVAHAETLKPVVEAAVHLRVINYDRALKRRVRSRIVIAVVYKANNNNSEIAARKIAAAFRALAKKVKVHGLPIAARLIEYSPETLADELDDRGATAIYVAPGLGDELPTIRDIAIQSQRPTMCGRRGLVKRGLVVLGVFRRDDHPAVAVNLKAARKVGMDIDASLFSLAEVFK